MICILGITEFWGFFVFFIQNGYRAIIARGSLFAIANSLILQLNQLKSYFVLLDTDQDGYIDKSNAILIIRGVGISGLDSVFESVIQSITTEALSFEDVLNVAISMKRTQVGKFSLFAL